MEQLAFPFKPVRPQCGSCGAFWRINRDEGECLGNVGSYALAFVVVHAQNEYTCHSSLWKHQEISAGFYVSTMKEDAMTY